MSANERQVAGTHYKSEYQHWDFCVEVLENRYLEGQVTKYLTRWRLKAGIQDLEKAMHFLEKLLEVSYRYVLPLAENRGRAQQVFIDACLQSYFEAHKELETVAERGVIEYIANWRTHAGLLQAKELLTHVIEEAKASSPTSAYVNQG